MRNKLRALTVLTALVGVFEGYRNAPYLDVGGVLTSGSGHRITGLEKGLTDEQILQNDLETALGCVSRNFSERLSPEQAGVLADLAYNLGCAGLLSTEFASQLKKGVFSERDLDSLDTAQGKTYRGLLIRRRTEACIYKSGNLDQCIKDRNK